MKRLNWLMAIAGLVGCLLAFTTVWGAKLYVIFPIKDGLPIGELTYGGYMTIFTKDGYGAFLFTGTKAQMDAIAAHKDAVVIGQKEYVENAETKKVELTNPTLTKEQAQKISAASIGTAKPVVKEGDDTNKTINAVFKMFHEKFDVSKEYLIDVEEPKEEPIKEEPKEVEVPK